MRFFLFLSVFTLILIPAVWAENDTGIRRFLNLTTEISCPGDILTIHAQASDGATPSGIELRIILYNPYNGIKGLTHTDGNGSASMELPRTGDYRIYFSTTDYNHPDYVEFSYPDMCPPPPPKDMNISVLADCENNLLLINATYDDAPLDDVFISSDSWSSMTGKSGSVVLPFQAEDFVFISAQKKFFLSQNGWFGTGCPVKN